jgi:hypothetical protein
MKTGVWLLNGIGTYRVTLTKIDEIKGEDKYLTFKKIEYENDAGVSRFNYYQRTHSKKALQHAVEGLTAVKPIAFHKAIEGLFSVRDVDSEIGL